MHGMFGLKYPQVAKRGDVTDAERTEEKRKDRATQPVICETLSLTMMNLLRRSILTLQKFL